MPVRQRAAQAAAGLVAVLLLASTVSALEINLPDISLPSLPEGWKLPSFDLPSPTEIRDFLNEKRQQAQQHLETALNDVNAGFSEFKSRFQRAYQNATEEAKRLEIYQQAVEAVNEFNQRRENFNFTLDLGPFADLSKEEFLAQKLGLNGTGLRDVVGTPITAQQNPAPSGNTPTQVNWVAQRKVAPIKDQGSCGSCWAFAAVSAIESASAILTDELYALSEQQVLSCGSARAVGGNGCNGGQLQWGFQYALRNDGLTALNAYPYTGQGGQACDAAAADWKVVQINGVEWVDVQDEQALMDAVAKGPVVVALSAYANSFQYYSGGIMDDFAGCCNTDDCQGDINHAVTIVGYDATAGYWLVRNSWGRDWGEDGYIKLAMGTPSGYPSGICGILSAPLAVAKETPNSVSGTPPAGAKLINLAGNGSDPSTFAAAGALRTSLAALSAGLLGAVAALVALA